MLRLYWEKIVLAGTFCFITSFSFSQTKMKFQSDYDAKKIRFGYLLGITSSHYTVKQNRSFLTQNAYYSITSPTRYHVRMGGLVNFSLNDYFDFRILPTVSIYSRALIINQDEELKQNDKAWIEVPVMLKYKSERRGNIRMFMFGGLRFGAETNVINFRGRRPQAALATKNADFAVEYGMGMEMFREYFKFAPELHFSHGLANLIDPVITNTSPLGRIEKLRSHTVSLIFTFE